MSVAAHFARDLTASGDRSVVRPIAGEDLQASRPTGALSRKTGLSPSREGSRDGVRSIFRQSRSHCLPASCGRKMDQAPRCLCAAAALFVLWLVSIPVVAAAEPWSPSKASSNVPRQVAAPAEHDKRADRFRELEERIDEPAPGFGDGDPDAGDAPAAVQAGFRPDQLVSPEGLTSTMNVVILTTVLALVPSILIMTTCFVRFAIVLGLLRQALGTQQLPSNQVLMGLCLFLTCMVMSPVWQRSYDEGIRPYTHTEPGRTAPSFDETFTRSVGPVREFMSAQIDLSGNSDTVWMFLDHQKRAAESAGKTYRDPEGYDDVPLATLISSYMLSELKTAFVIGFQIFLPFLVVDLVVASVLMSLGLTMVPPTTVSLPFKLLLFVLIDGWTLTIGRMLSSVQG